MKSVTWSTAVIAILAAAITSVALFFFFRPHDAERTAANGDVYARVMSSGVIRCGYVPYPPGLIKDPNTGKVSGVFADTIEQAATALDLKVRWTEEVGWGSMIEGLNADRYDLICSPVWANGSRAKVADFTVPLFYSGIGAYVRANDSRFTSAEGFNRANVRVATIDGEMSAIIAHQQYPNAATISLPQTSDDAQLLLNVASGKADVTFVEPFVANQYLASHPGSLKNVASDHPLRVFGNTMMLKKGEYRFAAMLDVALSELINSGEIDTLLQRYAGATGGFYPVAQPYGAASNGS